MSWEVRNMKLKVSFCNKTVLKTDITRFAPLWIGYTLVLAVMTLMSLVTPGADLDSYYAEIVHIFSARAGQMTLINGFYALIVAQVLWGDLLNPRMCNSLHAMPVTRDGYFGAHLLAALLFALVPNVLIFGVSALLVKPLVAATPLLTLGAACLQYLFYLGVALVAVQLSGNRISMVLAYGMLNFFTILLYWFCAQVFAPLIYGVELDASWVARVCPTVAMYSGSYFKELTSWDAFSHYYYLGYEMGDLFPHAILYAGIGIVLIAAAQLLYRKRKLEVAGDLMAYRFLSPVFLVLYTLMIAAFVHLGVTRYANSGSFSQYWFLPLGLLIGYVSGLMLLRRTSRVFRKRLLIPLAGILGLCVLAVGAIYTDLLGTIRYVPEAEDVVSVSVAPLSTYDGGAHYGSGRKELIVTDAQGIDTVLAYHRGELSGWQGQVVDALKQADGCWRPGDYYNVRLFYTLKNGRHVARRYAIRMNNPAMDRFKLLLSSPELAFGYTAELLRSRTDNAQGAEYYIYRDEQAGTDNQQLWYADTSGLADAILADCAEGTVINYSLKYGSEGAYDVRNIGSLDISGKDSLDPDNPNYYFWINIRPENTHILQWLTTHEGSTDLPRG